MKSGISASIVIPAKNEKENLRILLRRIRRLRSKYEVIVVDDSTDGSAEMAEGMGFRVIRNKLCKGKGYAMRVGFQNASHNVVVVLDADLSHNPEDIPRLLKPLEDRKVGVVIGSRILGGSDEYTFFRAIGNVLVTGSFNLLFGTRLFDSVNGFKALRKEIVKGTKINGFEIEFEMLANCKKQGFEIVEVPSHENARKFGSSKFNALVNGMQFFKQIVIEGVKYRAGL